MVKERIPARKLRRRLRTVGPQTARRSQPPAGEAFYRALIAHAFDLVQVIDAAGVVRYVSPAITHLLGYQPTDVVEKESVSLVHPDDVSLLREAITEIRGRPHAAAMREYRMRHHDGTWRRVEGTATNLLHDSTVAGIVIAARAITTRHASKQAARERETRYRSLCDAVADMMTAWTVEGSITVVNPAVQVLLGWTPEELIGQHYRTVFSSDAYARADDYHYRVLTGDARADVFTIDLVCKDGTTVPVEARMQPLHDHAGNLAGVASVFRAHPVPPAQDTAAPERLPLAERIVEAIPDLLYVYDLHRHAVVYVNRPASFLGRTSDEPERARQMLQDLIHADDLAPLRECYRRLQTEPRQAQETVEYRVRQGNGRWRWMADRVTVFQRTPNGAPVHVLGVVQDITARKRLEGLLQQRRIKPTDMAERLRKFRERLGMTQKEFGHHFGKYKTTQISTYETGVVTIPTGLLVAIWAKGFPVEVVFGATPTEIIEKTATYFSASLADRRFSRKVLESVVQRLQHDEELIIQALGELGLPAYGLQTGGAQHGCHIATDPGFRCAAVPGRGDPATLARRERMAGIGAVLARQVGGQLVFSDCLRLAGACVHRVVGTYARMVVCTVWTVCPGCFRWPVAGCVAAAPALALYPSGRHVDSRDLDGSHHLRSGRSGQRPGDPSRLRFYHWTLGAYPARRTLGRRLRLRERG
jgi:PAS domain S-box-containing protein